MRVLIFGAAGTLGTDLCATTPHGTSVVALDIGDADISDRAPVASALDAARPDWVLNAAAYTAVDRAESERSVAEAVNGVAPGVYASQMTEARLAAGPNSVNAVGLGVLPVPADRAGT